MYAPARKGGGMMSDTGGGLRAGVQPRASRAASRSVLAFEARVIGCESLLAGPLQGQKPAAHCEGKVDDLELRG